MAADPLLFMADLLRSQMRTGKIRKKIRFPQVLVQRWIGAESTEFPTISIFSHQSTSKAQGFEGKHYLNIRQVRIEIRTDDVEELHHIEEEVQYTIVSHCNKPQTRKYPTPDIEWMRLGSTVDVFETIIDVPVYRRSLLVDLFYQYSYPEDR